MNHAISAPSLEQTLQMKAWGYWARKTGLRLGFNSQFWQSQVPDEYPEGDPPAPIDEEYAEWIAKKLNQLKAMGHHDEIMVILQLYRGKSSKTISTLSTILQRPKTRLIGQRDFVLQALYGALTERN